MAMKPVRVLAGQSLNDLITYLLNAESKCVELRGNHNLELKEAGIIDSIGEGLRKMADDAKKIESAVYRRARR